MDLLLTDIIFVKYITYYIRLTIRKKLVLGSIKLYWTNKLHRRLEHNISL